MAKIVEYKEIPMDDLVIGKGQVRTRYADGIDELANSIRVQGLLQPIVVCESIERSGKWEILTGQRRFLANKRLNKQTITAAVLDTHVDQETAKAISITENLIRRKLSGKELIDGVTYLYNVYGTQKAVVDATGLPAHAVKDYVKYPRLIPVLKELVDSGTVDVNAALKAQDSAPVQDNGAPDPDFAERLAREFNPMSGPQRKNAVKELEKDPNKPIDDVIEAAKSGAKVIQVTATITQGTHTALRRFASNEGVPQDEAAALLIEYALMSEGLLN